MASGTYDIVTVGGGLGGSALAKAMAEYGARVLVVEREKQFKDRIRGEAMLSWGSRKRRRWASMNFYATRVHTSPHGLVSIPNLSSGNRAIWSRLRPNSSRFSPFPTR